MTQMTEILSRDEVAELTRYKRPREQMRQLQEMGVPATLLRDNTVRVLRAWLTNPVTSQAGGKPGPQLKSSRK